MITFRNLQEISAVLPQGSVVSWGNYDGVHLGHQALIKELTAKAKGLGLPSVIITFEPHPALFFSGGKAPHLIADYDDRLALIDKQGVDYALVLPFDEEFARQTPDEFVKNVLVGELKAKAVILGHDLSFGKNRAGGFEAMQALATRHGFSIGRTKAVMPEAQNNGSAPVASTVVRAAIKAGDVYKATSLLGRVHSVHGRVRHGMQRGKGLLGFPTANIDPGPLLLPPHGVYACLAVLDGKFYPAATNLGVNPSFDGTTPSLEAHMLDFEGDLYGHELRLYFLHFLRPEQKFETIEQLKEQIGRDVEKTRQIAAKAMQVEDFSTLFPL